MYALPPCLIVYPYVSGKDPVALVINNIYLCKDLEAYNYNTELKLEVLNTQAKYREVTPFYG